MKAEQLNRSVGQGSINSTSKNSARRRLLLAAAMTATLAGSVARGGTWFWDPGTAGSPLIPPSGTWDSSTSLDWTMDGTGGTAPTTHTTQSTDDPTFVAAPTATSGAYTVTISGSQAANSLNFQASGSATFSGGTSITVGDGTPGDGGINIPQVAYPSTSNGAVTFNTAVNLNNSQTWTNNSINTLTVQTGALSLGANALTIAGSGNTVISSVIGDGNPGGSITVGTGTAGSGTLTLSSTGNNYTGGTTVNGGHLTTTSDSTLGSGNITLENGGTWTGNFGGSVSSRTLILGTGGGTFSPTGDYVTTGTITGGTSLVVNSGDWLPIPSSPSDIGTLTITGANTRILPDPGSSSSTASAYFLGQGGTLAVVNVQNGASLDLGGNGVSLSVSNTMTFDGNSSGLSTRGVYLTVNTSTVTFPSTGALVLEEDDTQQGGSLTINGTWPTLTGNLTIQVGQGTGQYNGYGSRAPAVINANITDNNAGFGLTKTGPSVLVLTGTNTYTAGTIITDGTLQVGNGGSSGTLGSGPITDNANLTINLNSPYSLASVGGTGTITQAGSGTTTLSGTNTVSMVSVTGGALNLTGSIAGTLKLPSGSGTVNPGSGNAVATLDISAGAGTVNAGSTPLNFTAGGQVILNSGTATIDAGHTFTASGSNLVTSQSLNLTGGTLTLFAQGGNLINQGTGGAISVSGGNVIHAFTGNDSLGLPAGTNGVYYLIVGGGGGGGGNRGGGGGAGGLLTNVVGNSFGSLMSIAGGNSYAVTVGAGGNPSSNGGNSIFNGLTAIGGGAGGDTFASGASGGSGGGGGIANGNGSTAGSGTSGQGNTGGLGDVVAYFSAGGGGGAGQAGAAAGNFSNNGGAGGAGLASVISGANVTYAGGGGGGGWLGAGGAGGSGGGGVGAGIGPLQFDGAGQPNTGGGGGGGTDPGYSGALEAQYQSGAAGGSGIVIVSYAAQYNSAVINFPNTTISATGNATVDLAGAPTGNMLGGIGLASSNLTIQNVATAGNTVTFTGPITAGGTSTITPAAGANAAPSLILAGSNIDVTGTNDVLTLPNVTLGSGSNTVTVNGNGGLGTLAIPNGITATVAGGSSVALQAGTLSLSGTLAGTLKLPAGSTAAVNVGSGGTVNTLDVSAGAGTVNAGSSPLTITSTLKIPNTIGTFTTATLSGGTSFKASGNNLAAAGTLTLSGGTLSFTQPAPAPTITSGQPLGLWLDATDPNGNYGNGPSLTNGSSITTWVNKGSLGSALNATSTNGPTLVTSGNTMGAGSLAVMNFTAAGSPNWSSTNSQWMTINNATMQTLMAGSHTIFMAGRTTNVAAPDGYYQDFINSPGYHNAIGVGNDGTLFMNQYAGNTGGTTNNMQPQTTSGVYGGTTTAQIMADVVTSAGTSNVTGYVNGNQFGSVSASGTISYVNPGLWFIGAASTNPGYGNTDQGYLTGDIGEILVYNGALSPTDVATVDNYLTNKWVNGVLPAPSISLSTTAINATSSSTLDLGGAASGNQFGSLSLSGSITILTVQNVQTAGNTVTFTGPVTAGGTTAIAVGNGTGGATPTVILGGNSIDIAGLADTLTLPNISIGNGSNTVAVNGNGGQGTLVVPNGTTTTVTSGSILALKAGNLSLNGTVAGALSLPGGSIGTINVGSGGTVTNLDISAGAGTVNAGTNPLTIAPGGQLKLGGGTATIDGSHTFTASGSNLINSQTFNLSGGMMTLNVPGGNVVGNQGSGGTITVSGGNVIHTFTGNDFLTLQPGLFSYSASYLVVGGGGGGGTNRGGGGGAGGLLTNVGGTPMTLTGGSSYPVTIGAGGNPASNGANSVFNGVTALGGGAGGNTFAPASSGGSGGGGAIMNGDSSDTPGLGTPGQGNAGGLGDIQYFSAGGGGGAGEAGFAVVNGSGTGGAGGDGIVSTISGAGVTYAGGGGGGGWQGSNTGIGGLGGAGGGGAGAGTGPLTLAQAGQPNTGGGGGGGTDPGFSGSAEAAYQSGAAGGSGIVVVSYPAQYNSLAINFPSTTIAATANSTLDLNGAPTGNMLGGMALANAALTIQNVQTAGNTVTFTGPVTASGISTIFLASGVNATPALTLAGNSIDVTGPNDIFSLPTVTLGSGNNTVAVNGNGGMGSLIVPGGITAIVASGSTLAINGGRLGGQGTITGAVSVNNHGIISPGVTGTYVTNPATTDLGTLTTGNQVWGTGGMYVFKTTQTTGSNGYINGAGVTNNGSSTVPSYTYDASSLNGGATQDFLQIEGTLTVQSGFILDIVHSGSGFQYPNSSSFIVAQVAGIGSVTGATTANFTVEDNGTPIYNDTVTVETDGGNSDIVVTLTPEPGSLGLLGIASLGLLRRWRGSQRREGRS